MVVGLIGLLSAGYAADGKRLPGGRPGASGGGPYLFSYFKRNGEDGLHLAYSYDGYTWKALKGDRSFLKPRVGKSKLMRDPSVVKGPDGRFHMVWTTSWWDNTFGYANSRDLINWSEQKAVPIMKSEPKAKNVWAPELFHDEIKRRFMVVWSTTIPGRFPATAGDDHNHRIYYTVTRDFGSFTPPKLLYDPGYNCIDATIVRCEGRYVMFLKDERKKPVAKKHILTARATSPEGPYGGPSGPISGREWAEGPSAIRIGGKWFVYFDRYRKHRYGLVTSKDLENWTDESSRLSVPGGMRHGTAFAVERSVLERLLEL